MDNNNQTKWQKFKELIGTTAGVTMLIYIVGLLFLGLSIPLIWVGTTGDFAYTYYVFVACALFYVPLFVYSVCCCTFLCCIKQDPNSWRKKMERRIVYYSIRYAAIVTYIALIIVQIVTFINYPLFFWYGNSWYARIYMTIEFMIVAALFTVITAHFYIKRKS